jgi:hypothetical protein
MKMKVACQKKKQREREKPSKYDGRRLGYMEEDGGNFCFLKVCSLIFLVNIFVERE